MSINLSVTLETLIRGKNYRELTLELCLTLNVLETLPCLLTLLPSCCDCYVQQLTVQTVDNSHKLNDL